ncbi:NAD(P)H-dependent oxidoreductase [Actinobacillus minor]|uniref:NAD(P)H-dependent oxidoreductase n=1 Tax=Actinobacillus minor TaxID=51047 RepID=UPI0026F115EE|nr:NAD(P)H-dependent oxidoreductase [Actinobacillus minor]
MKKVLVISGHPNLSQSIANKTIIDSLASGLNSAEIRQLDRLYPTEQIDVAAEQQALLDADVIVWQFPFYWYSMPALMKKWLDEVFLHGFAHGSTAKLGGKKLVISITTGAPEVAYQENTVMKHTMAQLVAPFESIAALCQLDLQKISYLNGVSYVGRNEEKTAEQKQTAREYAKQLIQTINTLTGEK